jgi:hypothetical protein
MLLERDKTNNEESADEIKEDNPSLTVQALALEGMKQ